MISLLIRQNIFLQNGIYSLVQENSQNRGAEPGVDFSRSEDFENLRKQYIDAILRLEEINKAYSIKVQQSEAKVKDLEKENESLRVNIEQAKYKISQLEGELAKAREKIDSTSSLYEIAKHENSRLKDELTQINAKSPTYSVYENQIHVLEEKNKIYFVELEQPKTEIRHLKIENQALKADLACSRSEISQLRDELVQAKKYDLTSLIDEVKNLQVKFNKIQDKGILLCSSSTRTEEEKYRSFSSDEFKSIYGNIEGYIHYIEYVRSHLYEEFDESK